MTLFRTLTRFKLGWTSTLSLVVRCGLNKTIVASSTLTGSPPLKVLCWLGNWNLVVLIFCWKSSVKVWGDLIDKLGIVTSFCLVTFFLSYKTSQIFFFVGYLYGFKRYCKNRDISFTGTLPSLPPQPSPQLILLPLLLPLPYTFTLYFYLILLPYAFTLYFYLILLPYTFTFDLIHMYMHTKRVLVRTLSARFTFF